MDLPAVDRRQLLLSACALLPCAASARGPVPPPLLLAEDAPADVDPAGYLVSEKLDGVRALWDGKRLWFRSGRPITAPGWFLARLPQVPLDGELWLGRGRFEALSAVVRRQHPVDGEWRALHYAVFEAPGMSGSFAARAAALRQLAAQVGGSGLIAVDQERVADRAALQRRLDAVVASGGEGLMLHRADAPYLTGRSPVLLKLKPWSDAEGVVIGHETGQGRHAGRLGALRVRLVDGRELLLGTGLSDAQRAAPPPVGRVVTFRYRGQTAGGLPRFASFLRERTD